MALDLPSALADPFLGGFEAEFLYADELVFAWNLCRDLREHFLGDIFVIRGRLEAWNWLQGECLRESQPAPTFIREFRLRGRWH
jgi:hypothetical protein